MAISALAILENSAPPPAPEEYTTSPFRFRVPQRQSERSRPPGLLGDIGLDSDPPYQENTS